MVIFQFGTKKFNMSLLDELDKQRISERPIIDDDSKIVIVNSNLDKDRPWRSREYKIWFVVTSPIFLESIPELRFKKIFNELQNIPSIENMSKIFIYKYKDNICVGVNPNIRTGYGAVHLFWSVMTMFEHCFGFDVDLLCLYWFDDAYRRTYFKKDRIVDIANMIMKRKNSNEMSYRINSLNKVVEMLVGRPVSYLEHTDNMYRMAKWYIKTTDNFKALREHFGERPVQVTVK